MCYNCAKIPDQFGAGGRGKKKGLFFNYLKPVIRNQRNIREDIIILYKKSTLKYEIQQCYANPFQNEENFNFSYEIKMAYICMLMLL